MPTTRALKILGFLANNITSGVETVDEARDFIECLKELDEAERLFLNAALQNPETIGFLGEPGNLQGVSRSSASV